MLLLAARESGLLLCWELTQVLADLEETSLLFKKELLIFMNYPQLTIYLNYK